MYILLIDTLLSSMKRHLHQLPPAFHQIVTRQSIHNFFTPSDRILSTSSLCVEKLSTRLSLHKCQPACSALLLESSHNPVALNLINECTYHIFGSCSCFLSLFHAQSVIVNILALSIMNATAPLEMRISGGGCALAALNWGAC